MPYPAADRAALLDLARGAIAHGLHAATPPAVDVAACAPALRDIRASFVTIEIESQLRGCIGTLEAHRPLAVDVAHNAHAAGFRDPRFAPLSAPEFERIELHISVLTPPEPLPVADEADLLASLRRGIDGLILEDGRHRATFLPAVWDSLPDRREFLAHLKRKAGLPPNHWSRSIRFLRYEAEVID
ncbi:MAG: AmmeMemoRadiSam system protein A [Gammaproteobacteria bacterium]